MLILIFMLGGLSCAASTAPQHRPSSLVAESSAALEMDFPPTLSVESGARPAVLSLPAPPAPEAPSAGGSSSGRQLAACDLQALAQPAAVPSLAVNISARFGACSGLSGYTFSALMRNPNNNDVAIYLGVGQAQCSAGCV